MLDRGDIGVIGFTHHANISLQRYLCQGLDGYDRCLSAVDSTAADEVPFELAAGGGLLAGHRGGVGAPALLLHGGPGLPDYLGGCAGELADVLSTMRYSQRGNPPSTAGGPYAIENHMEDALGVLDAFGIEKAWAVGHSWGGHLALHLAVAHPDRLLGIVCVDTLGASDEVYGDFGANLTRELSPEQLARFQELDERDTAGTATAEESLEALAIIWPYYFADPASALPFPFERLGHGADTFTSIAEHFERGTLRDGLAHVTLPALFVHGVADPLPERASVDTAALMPNATVVLIEDCGHLPWVEQPGELRRAVSDFLARG